MEQYKELRNKINQYFDEASELNYVALDEKGDFINGYADTIHGILQRYVDKIYEQAYTSIENTVAGIDGKLFETQILYLILNELGFRLANKSVHDMENKRKQEAKTKLYMMQLKLWHEILYLLKGGVASAALARVRAVFEIAVIFTVIFNGDDSLAYKFLQHSNKNRLDIAKARSDQEMITQIKNEIATLAYGEDFLQYDYEWARQLVHKKGRISLKDMVTLAGLDDDYLLYVLCNSCVHANIYNSLYGLDIPKEQPGKPIWNTTPSEEGRNITLNILLKLSQYIVPFYIKHTDVVPIIALLAYARVASYKI